MESLPSWSDETRRYRYSHPGSLISVIGAYGREPVEIAAPLRAARHNTHADPAKTRPWSGHTQTP
jgi:hypothetical protein